MDLPARSAKYFDSDKATLIWCCTCDVVAMVCVLLGNLWLLLIIANNAILWQSQQRWYKISSPRKKIKLAGTLLADLKWKEMFALTECKQYQPSIQ